MMRSLAHRSVWRIAFAVVVFAAPLSSARAAGCEDLAGQSLRGLTPVRFERIVLPVDPNLPRLRLDGALRTLEVAVNVGSASTRAILDLRTSEQAWTANVRLTSTTKGREIAAVQDLAAVGSDPTEAELTSVAALLQGIVFELSDAERARLARGDVVVRDLEPSTNGRLRGFIGLAPDNVAGGDMLVSTWRMLRARRDAYQRASLAFENSLRASRPVFMANVSATRLGSLSEAFEALENALDGPVPADLLDLGIRADTRSQGRERALSAARHLFSRHLARSRSKETTDTLRSRPALPELYVPTALLRLDRFPDPQTLRSIVTDDRQMSVDIPAPGSNIQRIRAVAPGEYSALDSVVALLEARPESAVESLVSGSVPASEAADVLREEGEARTARALAAVGGASPVEPPDADDHLLERADQLLSIVEQMDSDLRRAAVAAFIELSAFDTYLDPQARNDVRMTNLRAWLRLLARLPLLGAPVDGTGLRHGDDVNQLLVRSRAENDRRLDEMRQDLARASQGLDGISERRLNALARALITSRAWDPAGTWRRSAVAGATRAVSQITAKDETDSGGASLARSRARLAAQLLVARAAFHQARLLAAQHLCSSRALVIDADDAGSQVRDLMDQTAIVLEAIGDVHDGIEVEAGAIRALGLDQHRVVAQALAPLTGMGMRLEAARDIEEDFARADSYVAAVETISRLMQEAERNPSAAPGLLDDALREAVALANDGPVLLAILAPVADTYLEAMAASADFADDLELRRAMRAVELQWSQPRPPNIDEVADLIPSRLSGDDDQRLTTIALYMQTQWILRLLGASS